MFDALQDALPDAVPEEVPSSRKPSDRTSTNHPPSQMFDSTYTSDSGARRSCRLRSADYRHFAHMVQQSLEASRILLSRSIRHYIEEPTDMNFAYALLLDLVQAPMLYYNHLKDGLKACGLEPSEQDPCMFIGRGMTALSYVDDVLWFGPDLVEIDKVIQELKDNGMALTVEADDIDAFLGVDIVPMENIAFESSNEGFYMSQTGLIDKVLKTVGMLDSRQKRTPASSTPLGTDAKDTTSRAN
jgi:hypothetical protein